MDPCMLVDQVFVSTASMSVLLSKARTPDSAYIVINETGAQPLNLNGNNRVSPGLRVFGLIVILLPFFWW